MTAETLYTSNFRTHWIPGAYSIARYTPRTFPGKRLTYLAPSATLLKGYKQGRVSETKYTTLYLRELHIRLVNPHKVVNSLPDSAILLCYEPPGDFCHRHILADWLMNETGCIVEEIANA